MPTTTTWFKPQEFPLLTTNKVHVWLIDMIILEPYFSDFFALLSEDEKKRADRFHFKRDQNRFTISRACLRLLLSKYIAKNASDLIFTYHEHGKPSLVDHPNLQFNISHSEKLTLVAINYDHPVGIDIEFMEKNTDIDGIVRRFFSANEIQQFNALPTQIKKAAFFKGWTCKEALLKATGAGLSVSLKNIEVDLEPGLPAAIIAINDDRYKNQLWSLQQLHPRENFAAALAIDCPTVEMQLWEFSLNLFKFQ